MQPINTAIIELRKETGLNRKEFSSHFGIPLRTVEDWEAGRRTPPEYIPRLIKYQIEYEKLTGKRELNWFMIEDAYGGNQDWMIDDWMKRGGCGALTACDSCIYFAKEMAKQDPSYTSLYPFDRDHLTKEDYIRFGDVMKPYLAPRKMGINTLKIYMDGFQEYLDAANVSSITMTPFPGTRPFQEAKAAVKQQIDKRLPIPCLVLHHKNPDLADYVWHWFLLIGYEQWHGEMMVKAVTYGEYRWLSLAELWDTGYEERGGLVMYENG